MEWVKISKDNSHYIKYVQLTNDTNKCIFKILHKQEQKDTLFLLSKDFKYGNNNISEWSDLFEEQFDNVSITLIWLYS